MTEDDSIFDVMLRYPYLLTSCYWYSMYLAQTHYSKKPNIANDVICITQQRKPADRWPCPLALVQVVQAKGRKGKEERLAEEIT